MAGYINVCFQNMFSYSVDRFRMVIEVYFNKMDY